jgi:formylmethanofuran dehydrogenase subunit E
MSNLNSLLDASAARHRHLCPRQVLGVRMGLYAGRLLGLELPQSGKRLLTIAETDGCTVDGLSVATNCWVGHRTLRVEDYGKVAATFVDVKAHSAIRIAPSPQARTLAVSVMADAGNRWEAYLHGYQIIADSDLFVVQRVTLTTPVEAILGQPGSQAICARCGEEVINLREVIVNGETLCRACASGAYYTVECFVTSDEATVT